MNLLEALAALPHFQLLGHTLLGEVAGCTKQRPLHAGEVVFHEGQGAQAFFVIVEGAVKLYRSTPDGREQVLHHLSAGQTFAEAALFHIGRFPATAVATESPTLVLEIGGDCFLDLFRRDHRLAQAMIGSLCMRMISLVDRVEELSLVNAGSRLARYLLRQPSQGPAECASIELGMAKKELAAHLSMTPETLSRLLRRWQDEGWVRSERSTMVVLAAEELARLADGMSGNSDA